MKFSASQAAGGASPPPPRSLGARRANLTARAVPGDTGTTTTDGSLSVPVGREFRMRCATAAPLHESPRVDIPRTCSHYAQRHLASLRHRPVHARREIQQGPDSPTEGQPSREPCATMNRNGRSSNAPLFSSQRLPGGGGSIPLTRLADALSNKPPPPIAKTPPGRDFPPSPPGMRHSPWQTLPWQFRPVDFQAPAIWDPHIPRRRTPTQVKPEVCSTRIKGEQRPRSSLPHPHSPGQRTASRIAQDPLAAPVPVSARLQANRPGSTPRGTAPGPPRPASGQHHAPNSVTVIL